MELAIRMGRKVPSRKASFSLSPSLFCEKGGSGKNCDAFGMDPSFFGGGGEGAGGIYYIDFFLFGKP